MQGRVVAFGGRSLDGQEPKYLNSPESEIFEKGKCCLHSKKHLAILEKEIKLLLLKDTLM